MPVQLWKQVKKWAFFVKSKTEIAKVHSREMFVSSEYQVAPF